MVHKYLLLCLFGISVYFVDSTVASEVLIGAHKASANQFPYLVSVQKFHEGHICGGGIIDDHFILTAAHCVVNDDGQFDANHIQVLAGTRDLRNTEKPAMIVRVKKVYVPKVYNAIVTRAIGDIAVLRLEHPLEFSRHIQKLNPPSQDSYAGKTATLAGFGWDWIRINGTEEDGGHSDSHLRFAEADILSKKECEDAYGVHHMPDLFVCAKIKQHDAHRTYGPCFGDSGGVLVHDHTAIGILSHSPNGCSEEKQPSIYVGISSYLNLIENAMKDIHSPDIRSHDVKH